MLYILISVLGTTDLMLLLPEHMFKMPLINFDLNLIAFYILAPIMLFMLHFNILFNYNMYLKKIDLHHKKINMNTLDPSIYGYAYTMISRGFDGFLINLFLWIWIYIIPLTVLIFIYLRFSDYHNNAITIFHFVMVLLDIYLIFLSFYYNNIHLKHQQKAVRILAYLFRTIFAVVFILAGVYYYFIFNPVINNKLDTRIKLDISKLDTKKGICDNYIKQMYNFIVDNNESFSIPSNCFPRLVVNEAEMAKISHSALYLPRFLIEDNNKNKNTSQTEKEKQLILEYGARSNLAGRNLRYANLYGCILTRADLTSSDLQVSDLRRSHLQAAKLKDANLYGAYLMGSKLDKADLKDANLTGANLTFSMSEEGQFPSATFINSSMIAINFEKADFSEANLTNVNLMNAKLPYSRFYATNLTGATLDNCNLTQSDLSKTILISSSLRKCALMGATFYGAYLNNSSLREADLTAASLRNSNLSNTDFKDATLLSVDFSGTYTDRKKKNISLKIILKSAKEVGGIIIQDIKSIKNKKPDRTYFTDENLTTCEKYLTIKLEDSDVDLKVTKRRIKYLVKGIEKYNDHEGEPATKCLEVNSTKLSKTLQNALDIECSFLEDFLKKTPRYKKTYAQTIKHCKKVYTKKETKDSE